MEVKIKFGEKEFDYKIEEGTEIDDLLSFVVGNCDLLGPIMEYIDGDGDRVRIADNEDLKNLLKLGVKQIFVRGFANYFFHHSPCHPKKPPTLFL